MKSILNQLSNPFDTDNFKKLINLYLESTDYYNFYERIVTYHQDRDMTNPPQSVPRHLFETIQYQGHWYVREYFSDFFPTEHRIYINSSLNATGRIVQLFTDECIRQNLPFQLKYIGEANPRSDGIVIGSNSKVYKKHIDILRKLSRENPDLIDQCGTPHILTAPLDGWMGLADENVSNRYRSYTQSRLDIFYAAIKSFLIKHPEYAAKINGFDQFQSIYNKKVQQGYSEQQLSLCDRAFFNKFNPSDLKTILQDNDLAIAEIYSFFQNHLKLQGINPEMPTLYEGSKEALTYTEDSTMIIDYTQVDKKSPISLINDYFSTENNILAVEDEIHLLKIIDEKFVENACLQNFMFNELKNLINHNVINKDILANNLFTEILDNNTYPLIRNSTEIKFPSIRSMLNTQGENMSAEQSKKTLDIRIDQLRAYFSAPTESLAEKQTCLDTLKKMLDNYQTKNPHLDPEVIKNFDRKIQNLEFKIQNHDALLEYYKLITCSIEEKSYTNNELHEILESFKPKQILVHDAPPKDMLDDLEMMVFMLFEGPTKYELEKIPEASPKDINYFETLLYHYIHQIEPAYSAQDIGIASYDANPYLCEQAARTINNIERNNKNDHIH